MSRDQIKFIISAALHASRAENIILSHPSFYSSHLFIQSIPTPSSLPRLLDRLNNLIHHTRVRKRARVAELVLLARQDLAQNASHDLA